MDWTSHLDNASSALIRIHSAIPYQHTFSRLSEPWSMGMWEAVEEAEQ